jgi:hypothetical protein
MKNSSFKDSHHLSKNIEKEETKPIFKTKIYLKTIQNEMKNSNKMEILNVSVFI